MDRIVVDPNRYMTVAPRSGGLIWTMTPMPALEQMILNSLNVLPAAVKGPTFTPLIHVCETNYWLYKPQQNPQRSDIYDDNGRNQCLPGDARNWRPFIMKKT